MTRVGDEGEETEEDGHEHAADEHEAFPWRAGGPCSPRRWRRRGRRGRTSRRGSRGRTAPCSKTSSAKIGRSCWAGKLKSGTSMLMSTSMPSRRSRATKCRPSTNSCENFVRLGRRRQAVGRQAQLRHDGDDEEQARDAVDPAGAQRCDQHAAHGRRDDAREVLPAGLQRHRVHQLVLRYEQRHDGRPRRHVEREHDAGDDRRTARMCQNSIRSASNQRRDDEAGGRREGLGDHEQRLLVDAVGDDAGDRGEEQHRQRDRDGGEAEGGSGVGQLEREVAAQDELHLHGHEEGQRAGEVPAKLRLFQRREGRGSRQLPRGRRCGPVAVCHAVRSLPICVAYGGTGQRVCCQG